MPAKFNLHKLAFDFDGHPASGYSLRTDREATAALPASQFTLAPRLLPPGAFSFPYHSHRHAEELFVILEGSAKLRTPEGISIVTKGDVVFFPKGNAGAHQLHNDSDTPCVYLDLRITPEVDICDYPDSGKLQILKYGEIFRKDSAVPYFSGEEAPEQRWTKLSNTSQGTH